MKINRILTYIEQMQESVFLACSYIEGIEKADFLADKKTQQAVVLNTTTQALPPLSHQLDQLLNHLKQNP